MLSPYLFSDCAFPLPFLKGEGRLAVTNRYHVTLLHGVDKQIVAWGAYIMPTAIPRRIKQSGL